MKEYSLIELNELLNQKELSSVDLVNMYLNEIHTYDHYLNSIAELNPDALKIAAALDEEREKSGPRSLLHGIPILIKDNINTHDKMHTTASSLALADLIAPYDATIVSKCREAGAIILGKTNLSEFAYFMSTEKMPSGYGSRHGQVKHPYHPNIDPLGSSTGSAVAVAANLIPVAIGTETNGSLMAPAYQNSIVSFKPTLGLISRYGIIPISHLQDTAGPMGRTVEDCAILLDQLTGYDPHDAFTQDAILVKPSFYEATKTPLKKAKIGIVTFKNYPTKDVDLAILEQAKKDFHQLGIQTMDIQLELANLKNFDTLLYEFKEDLNHYLQTVKGCTKMTSLSDIISFNERHADQCLAYGQNILVESNQTSIDDPKYIQLKNDKLKGASTFEHLLRTQKLSALVSIHWLSYAPMFGNPSIVVPAKKLTDDQPKSLVFVGKKWDDAALFTLASAYEKYTKHRIPPVKESYKKS